MSAGGVIPLPEERGGVRALGTVKDIDGFEVGVCTERGFVRLEVGTSVVLLNVVQAEEFAQLFVRACWMTGR